VIDERQVEGLCRRKIEMSPVAQSRDDTPIGGGQDELGHHNQARDKGANWIRAVRLRSAIDCLVGSGLNIMSLTGEAEAGSAGEQTAEE
jgi:hypothetical protein